MVNSNEHKCQTPDTIDFERYGWTCPECGQVWIPEEIEPGGFSWTKMEEDE